MDNSNKPPIALKLLAGGIAGASETMVTYPAEFIKTRRQLPPYTNLTTSRSSNINPNPKSISSLAIIRNTYSTVGIRGFYSGCGALATSNFLKSSIRFFTFSTSRDFYDLLFQTPATTSATTSPHRSPLVNILSGFTAGVSESLLVVTPGEALKTRLVEDAAAASTANNGRGRFVGRSFPSVALTVVREEGVRALWRGAVPVVSRQATNSMVRFTAFAMMQERVERRWGKGVSGNVGVTLGMGAVSGVVTVYASMPFDNMKTRMQSVGGGYSSMLDCATKTLKRDGIWAFWRGTGPRLVRLTLSSGIAFTVYDQVIQTAKVFQHQPMKELQTM